MIKAQKKKMTEPQPERKAAWFIDQAIVLLGDSKVPGAENCIKNLEQVRGDMEEYFNLTKGKGKKNVPG